MPLIFIQVTGLQVRQLKKKCIIFGITYLV